MRLVIGVVLAIVLVTGPAASAGDPDWVFYTKDKTRYTSPWFAKGHRIMVPFGCTKAPYYDPDPRCKHHHGFHHGIDIAMVCGTKIYAGRRLRVVDHSSLGPAYGKNPMLLRNKKQGWDVVIGHTLKVFKQPGDKVRKGELLAYANKSGAPDGCHLHFEVRDVGGDLDTARRPKPLLDLTPVDAS